MLRDAMNIPRSALAIALLMSMPSCMDAAGTPVQTASPNTAKRTNLVYVSSSSPQSEASALKRLNQSGIDGRGTATPADVAKAEIESNGKILQSLPNCQQLGKCQFG